MILGCNYDTIYTESIALFLNKGGFHLIGSGSNTVYADDYFAAVRHTVTVLGLDALVISVCDDINSKSIKLAEDFKNFTLPCFVNCLLKNIDKDMWNDHVGGVFRVTHVRNKLRKACCGLVIDGRLVPKAWHFVRVMTRSVIHIALEDSLKAHPNICFIGKGVQRDGIKLANVITYIANVVAQCGSEKNEPSC